MNGKQLTEKKISFMQNFLKENPIDPKWDEACEMLDDRYPAFRGENDVPLSQELARAYHLILEKLGRLPQDP